MYSFAWTRGVSERALIAAEDSMTPGRRTSRRTGAAAAGHGVPASPEGGHLRPFVGWVYNPVNRNTGRIPKRRSG
jgi:hypothetical protein